MNDKTEKQPTEESKAFRQYVSEPNKSQPQHTAAEDELHAADTNVGLQILDILDALPFYALLVDEHHYILQANSAVREELGLEPKDIIGKYCPRVVHGIDEPFYACPLEEAVKKDQAVEWEVLDRESGRWILSAIYPTRGLTRDGRRILFHMVTDITERKEAEKVRGQLLEELISAQEEERKRISRELHDEASQALAALAINLEAIQDTLPKRYHDSRKRLGSLKEQAIRTLEDIRSLALELRPSALDDLGLPMAIDWYAKDYLVKRGLDIKVEVIGSEKKLPSYTETMLFRIIQEALTNVVKYAEASEARVRLELNNSMVIVQVEDNGKGFDAEAALRGKRDRLNLGLQSMAERATLLGGTIAITSQLGQGTCLRVEVPLVEENAHNE